MKLENDGATTKYDAAATELSLFLFRVLNETLVLLTNESNSVSALLIFTF